MPFELDVSPPLGTITVTDNNGKTADNQFFMNVPAGYTVQDAVDVLNFILLAYEPATNGRVIGGSVTVPLINVVAEPTPAPPESEVERKLALTLKGNASRYATTTLAIPSPVFTLEVSGSDGVNTASPIFLALQTALLANVRTNRNEVLDRIARAKFVHRYRRPT